jgi:putative peptidoglycan lipid II flippase
VNTVKKFWYYISNKKLTIGNAAVILGVTGLLSNILGLWRERVIAGAFGASSMTDAFYASFKIPDTIFNLLILGALSSAFIPVLVEKISAKNQEDVNNLASAFLNSILLIAAGFAVVIFVLAPQLVHVLFPGFIDKSIKGFNVYQTTVTMTRLMLVSPIIFCISGVFGGILNSYKRFIAFSIAPLIYNLSIIFSATFLLDKFHPPIFALAVGVIVGACLHALVQLPSVISSGFRWQPVLTVKNNDLKRILRLMVPTMISTGVGQINLYVDAAVASLFTAIGGITVINFANDIQTAPTVIFGIAIATAVFPVLSEAASKKDMGNFMENFSWSTRRILYFTIPATVGLIVLRAQVIRLVFGIGNFSWNNTYWTTEALLFFSFGLVAQGLIPLLLKAFYAIQDTKTPLYVSFAVMLINAVLSVTLPFMPQLGLGVAGIALAFTIAGCVNAIALFLLLHNKIGALDPDHKIFESTTRLAIASALMGAVVHYSLYLFDPLVNSLSVIGLLMQTLGAIALGGFSYVLLTWLFRCEETKFVLDKLRIRANESV